MECMLSTEISAEGSTQLFTLHRRSHLDHTEYPSLFFPMACTRHLNGKVMFLALMKAKVEKQGFQMS